MTIFNIMKSKMKSSKFQTPNSKQALITKYQFGICPVKIFVCRDAARQHLEIGTCPEGTPSEEIGA